MSGKNVYKWTAIDRICNSVMTFGGNIFLARMLDPTDFGLLSMVAIFTALASNISGCGMSDGLINKEKPTAVDYSTVFVFNSSMGLLFAVLFIGCSGMIAGYFGYAELRGIMIAIGVCFFFHSLAMIQETRMRKELDFKRMALVRLSATFTSLVLAVYLALNGYTYWALVSMQVFLSVFLFIYYMLVSRWLPRLAFSRQSFKEMFGYGVHLMLAYVCYQTAKNINTSVLGKFSLASSSGVYSQGQKMEEVPFNLCEAILNWPFFAVLASSHDKTERRKLTGQMHSVIVFVNATIAVYLFAVSQYAFNALFGAKWDAAVPIFNILLIFGFVTAVKMFYQTVFKAHAKTKLIRNFTVVEVVLQLGLLAIFYRSSASVIAFTQVIPAVAVMLIYIPLYMKLEGISLKVYFNELFSPMFFPVSVMLVTVCSTLFWAPRINSYLALLVVSAVFGLLLIGLCELKRPVFYIDAKDRILKRNNSND